MKGDITVSMLVNEIMLIQPEPTKCLGWVKITFVSSVQAFVAIINRVTNIAGVTYAAPRSL